VLALRTAWKCVAEIERKKNMNRMPEWSLPKEHFEMIRKVAKYKKQNNMKYDAIVKLFLFLFLYFTRKD
jgi:hypothetical protein